MVIDAMIHVSVKVDGRKKEGDYSRSTIAHATYERAGDYDETDLFRITAGLIDAARQDVLSRLPIKEAAGKGEL